MNDKYTVPAIRLIGPPGGTHMLLERFSDKRKSVAVYISGHDHAIENIVGVAKFWRREDNVMMMAEIEFLAVPKRAHLEDFWKRGRQLYVNTHLRRHYDPSGSGMFIDIDNVELQETSAMQPYGYTPGLFCWP